jgi:hypothetical protein
MNLRVPEEASSEYLWATAWGTALEGCDSHTWLPENASVTRRRTASSLSQVWNVHTNQLDILIFKKTIFAHIELTKEK